jgi:hypothetical protein
MNLLFCSGNFKTRCYVENLVVDGKIISKWMHRKRVKVWNGCSWFRRLYGGRGDLSGALKTGTFLAGFSRKTLPYGVIEFVTQ